jgi:hypothetical protein
VLSLDVVVVPLSIAIYQYNTKKIAKMFRPTFWWYQSVILLRRVVVALIMNIIFSTLDKYLAISLANLAFLLLHTLLHPFTHFLDNVFETVSLSILCILSIVLTRYPPPIDEQGLQVVVFLIIVLPWLVMICLIIKDVDFRGIWEAVTIFYRETKDKLISCCCSSSNVKKEDVDMERFKVQV